MMSLLPLRVVRPAAAALLALTVALPAWAQEPGAPLFRDLRYDAPISAFGEAQSYYDCSADVGATARCIDDVKFLGHTFDTQILTFVGNRLRSVQLATEFKPEIYASLMKALAADFTLVIMQSGDRRLDLVETARQQGESKLGPRVSEFESIGLNKGDLTYVFVELPATTVKKFPTGVDAIMKSPPTTREADVVLREKDKEAWLSVMFSLPRRALEDMRNMPVPKEKF